MTIWHRAILLVVGVVAVATEETEKFAKQATDEVQKQIDRQMKHEQVPELAAKA